MKQLAKLLSLIAMLCIICACFTACEMHTHEYQYSVTKEATCEFSGISYGYCSCGKTDEKVIPALGHTFKNDVCSVCGFNRLSDHVHTVVIDEGLPATCESIGLTEGSHCSACNMIITKQEVIPAIGHLFMKYTFDNNSTCQQDGTKTAVCDREGCNVTDTRVAKGTKTEHQYNSTTVAPTCVAKGYTLYLCACGDSYMGDYVNTIAHIYNQEVAKSEYLMQEATCKTPAQYYKSCSCGKAGTQSFVYGGTLAHAYSNTWSYSSTHHWYEATCGCDAISRYEMHNSVNGFCSICGIPTESTVGVMYDLSADGTYAEVIGYTGTDKRVVIASEYQGKPVTNIYKEAFRDNDKITEVIFPETLLTIGDYAFYSCSNLTSVIISDSVTSIGSDAFKLCSKLKFNEYENCKYIGSATNPYFALIEGINSNLSSITIHNDAKIIADYAFSGYARLTSVVIGDSVISIGAYAFYDCSKLTKVYYKGNISDWSKISIRSFNYGLTNATRYYYSESQPTESGNFWHYDENGNVVVW